MASLIQVYYTKGNSFYLIKIGALVSILGKLEVFMDLASKTLLIIHWRDDIDSTFSDSILKLLY